jgi:LPXTG-site transpeptidase (sortase) family protein
MFYINDHGIMKTGRFLAGLLLGIFSFSFIIPVSSTLAYAPAEPAVSVPLTITAVKPPNIALNELPTAGGVPAIVAVIPNTISFPKVAIIAQKAVINIPEAHLLIPKIRLDAIIKDEGMTPGGAMAIPGNNLEAGWFDLGTRPGEIGSAVIGGHNRWNNNAGVFGRLNELQKGDVLTVIDANGLATSFTVSGTRLYDPTDNGKSIFDSPSGSHLNLITCSGTWDAKTNSYTKRLVIFTDLNPVVSVL